MNSSACSVYKPSGPASAFNLSKRGSFYDPFLSSRVYESHLHQSLINHEPATTQQQGISVKRAALSFISTIIGAGIVSLPYVVLQAGFALGAAMHLTTITMLLFAVHLLLRARQNLGFE